MFLAVLQLEGQSGRHGAMKEQPELSQILQESLAVEVKQHGTEIKSTLSTKQTINNINGTLIDYHTYSKTSVNFFLGHPVDIAFGAVMTLLLTYIEYLHS